MKKTIFGFTIILFFLLNCSKSETTTPTPVKPTAPTASFTFSNDVLGSVTFTNSSKNAQSYEWDFGDNSAKSTETNPVHKFAANGKYKVSVKATGEGGTNTNEQEVTIIGYQVEIATIDNNISALMQKYNLPGVTLAISKGGKLVYVKGYGIADKEKNEKVSIESRFRVGSMSKTLCAISILKLIQDGKLKLDDKVFGDGAILGTLYGTKTYSADLKTITVKNLLNHNAGAWGTADNQGDVMGQVPTASNKDFFSYILDNFPLVTKPGARYSYANFGYFILARIVDKVSGKTYIDYLNDDVLKGIGLKNRVELSGATEAERKDKEVKYYGQTTAETNFIYNLNFNRRDGSGGMLMTATDYLKIINAVDGFTSRADILNQSSLTTFTTPANTDPYYACGSQILQGGYWTHTGSINCQYGQWYRGPNEINVVLIANSRADGANATLFNQFGQDFQSSVLFPIQTATISWQNIDQF